MSDVYLIASASGSTDWSSGTNWSSGSPPATGDNVYILSGSASLDTNISQTSVVLASLTVSAAFAGNIGGLGTNALQIGVSSAYIGILPADGTQGVGVVRCKLDTGTNAATVVVYGSRSQGLESPLPPICIKGSNSANALSVLGGAVGVGVLAPNETDNWPSLDVTGGRLTIGSSNVAYVTLANRGGTVSTIAGQAAGTINNLAGSLSTSGQFAIGTLLAGGNTAIGHRAATGTSIGTLTIAPAGQANFAANPAAVSLGSTVIQGGTLSVFDAGQVTFGSISIGFGSFSRLTSNLS